MSRENVELVKALCPQPDTDIAALFRDDQAYARFREAFAPRLTDDFQSVMVWPGQTQTDEGLKGARQNWLDWLEPWATYRTTIDDVIDAGEQVVVLLRDYGRRQDMDAEVEIIGAAIWTIRDGKVARIEHHAHRAEAFEAAGLSESAHTSP
jgi:ketosteroid isomerase-like protein